MKTLKGKGPTDKAKEPDPGGSVYVSVLIRSRPDFDLLSIVNL